MCMIKAPTIMKQNPLIMAEFRDAFSDVDHDVVNVLIHALQNELLLDNMNIDLFNYKDIVNRTVSIRASKFKEFAKLGKNSNKLLFESLKKIRDTSATIRKFTDIDGKYYRASTISIVDSVAWIDLNATQDHREHTFEIQFSDWFLKASTKTFNAEVGNYSNIEIDKVSSIRSPFAKKMYEVLESKKYRGTSFSLNIKEINKIFKYRDSSFSYFLSTLKRNYKKVNEIIPFSYESFKKDKIISFKYEKSSPSDLENSPSDLESSPS